jgi:hypothetical protein
MRLWTSLLVLLLASGAARAEPPAPAGGAPASPPPGGAPRDASSLRLGFGAELGASPTLFGAKAGIGSLRGGDDAVARRWMAWLAADGTDWFRPSRPAGAARVDRVLWLHPHLELARQLTRRLPLSGWIRAGPTLGRYTAGGGVAKLWFPGLGVGAGILLDHVSLGVTYYGQWKTATIRRADPFASPDVRLTPMVFVTAGLELLTPFASARPSPLVHK